MYNKKQITIYSISLIILFIISILIIIYTRFFKNPMSCMVIEHNDIEILQDCVPETITSHDMIIILFDIDNTLVEPVTELGSDQWFYAFVHYLEQEHGYSHQEAIQHTVPLLKEIMAVTELQLVQSEIPTLLNNLKKQGIHLLALTARSICLAHRTIEQLKHININFCDNIFNPTPVHFSLHDNALYECGIIFSGNNKKGDVLIHVLAHFNIKPTRIIFIDDKMKNILDVQKALVHHHIPFLGIRYSRLDEKIHNFTLDNTWNDLYEISHTYPSIEHVNPIVL